MLDIKLFRPEFDVTPPRSRLHVTQLGWIEASWRGCYVPMHVFRILWFVQTGTWLSAFWRK